MKTFLLIFIFPFFLNADTLHDGRCVKKFTVEYTTPNNSKYIRVIYYNDTQALITYADSLLSQLTNNIDKFTYSSFYQPLNGLTYNICTPKGTDNQIIISSLTGILIGFTILFFSIFLTIKVGSRND